MRSPTNVPEPQFTRIRGTGAGWAAGFGRPSSIIAPQCLPAMLATGGVILPFAVFAVAAAAALTLPDLRGTALDD
ncbi:hypothetical protein [Rathayibacter sp. VKM Ac-2858]|uniref:hypothetical protein n=1 Tax=unclassified Rathayibacter TaxID=2609250 RepID=UPI00349F3A36